MNRLQSIGISTLLSGGIINHGTLGGYVADAARRTLGIGLAHFQDGAVHYFSKDAQLLKRGLIQTAHQTAYGLLNSYPRYLKYLEQQTRDKYLTTASQTSIANRGGQYFQLISEQKAVAEKKNYTDTIVGNVVADFLELRVPESGQYYDVAAGGIKPNRDYGLVTFCDLQPEVQVSSKNNITLTTVQGRDCTRKEFISGGDVEISVSGKITSKYPDVYPEAEVSKFLKLMQYKGVLECDNTILRQFNVTSLIVLNYAFGASECRNVQPYTMSCVAVEPSEAIEVKLAKAEQVDAAIKHTNKWIKWAKFGAEVIDPATLLKVSRLWI
jgi:hypothetical protein